MKKDKKLDVHLIKEISDVSFLAPLWPEFEGILYKGTSKEKKIILNINDYKDSGHPQLNSSDDEKPSTNK